MNEAVYNKLIGIAKKKKSICYEDLVAECNLHLNLGNIDDRNKLSYILGEISKYELSQNRPPLSVLVVLENKIMPSYGFFNFMDELKVRKPEETDEQLRNRLMNWSYEYWSVKKSRKP